MSSRNTALTLTLARFVAQCPQSALLEPSRQAGRLALLNWFGCAIAGAQTDTVDRLVSGFRAAGSGGRAAVLGRTDRFNPLAAATVNGTASAVLDFDSPQHRKTNIHPSGPVVPAMLALCASEDAPHISGADFLHAYLLGVEVACRIANTVFGSGNPGWHVTGAAGGSGAAAAVGRLLGADAPTIRTAIGIAATQAGGLREMYGTMCKALTPGRAAETGLLAALLACRGFTSAEWPLEGAKGLAAVFTGTTDLAGLVDGLGDGFEIDAMAHKPYPCAVVTHAVIDGCILLRDRIGSATVTDIGLTVSPIARELAGKTGPSDGLEAKFSLTHAAAVALIYGAARTEHFSADALRDPAIAALWPRVRIDTDRAFRKEEARVSLRTAAGTVGEVHIAHATGSLGHPMTQAQLVEKFLGLTVPVIGREKAEALAKAVLGIEAVPDLGALISLSRPD